MDRPNPWADSSCSYPASGGCPHYCGMLWGRQGGPTAKSNIGPRPHRLTTVKHFAYVRKPGSRVSVRSFIRSSVLACIQGDTITNSWSSFSDARCVPLPRRSGSGWVERLTRRHVACVTPDSPAENSSSSSCVPSKHLRVIMEAHRSPQAVSLPGSPRDPARQGGGITDQQPWS